MMVSALKVCQNLTIMQNSLSQAGLYTNAFHRKNSMAALREVQRMSLHPYSREQKLQQIAALRQASATSKESSNALRRKLNE